MCQDSGRQRGRVASIVLAVALALSVCLVPTCAVATEMIFLQDGRTIRADKVEIIGDTVRIHKPAETIELPRSEVLSIHSSAPPKGSPGPADVYRDTTRQMNEKVRREIESRPGP